MNFITGIAILWVIIDFMIYHSDLSSANSAPQQAAAAAMACASLIFPYMLYRIFQGQAAINNLQAIAHNQHEIIKALRGDKSADTAATVAPASPQQEGKPDYIKYGIFALLAFSILFIAYQAGLFR